MAEREPDSSIVICKICSQPKTRTRKGKFGLNGGRTPRWIDEDGKLWNGRICGKCHIKQCVARQYIKRTIGE